jgi:hypothetical protein
MKDTALNRESIGPDPLLNPTYTNTSGGKIHYNGKKIFLLTFTGSLGGLSVGYNCGIVAGACLYMDQVFSGAVTLADKSVWILYT